MSTIKSTKLASLFLLCTLATLGFATTTPALAGEAHPKIGEFGHNATEAFSNPNGIAVEESTGDVYVADIGTNTVYKFDANGNPVNFSAVGLGSTNELTGSATPATSFSFPTAYGSPAASARVCSAESVVTPCRSCSMIVMTGRMRLAKEV